jgi:hypothetical protein
MYRIELGAHSHHRHRSTGRTYVRRFAALTVVMLYMAPPCWALHGAYSLLSSAETANSLLDDGLPTPAGCESLGNCLTDRLDHAIRMPAQVHTPETRPSLLAGALLSTFVVAYSAANSFPDHHRPGFHFANEGWFGEDTYVGGADKTSHFLKFEIIARGLTVGYEYFGFPQLQSAIAGAIVSSLGGLVNEIGDGTNRYGFSYEDLVMDVGGAGAAAAVILTGTDDLIGFRVGLVPGPSLPEDPDSDGFGKDYSREIYTADLLLTGVIRRTGARSLWPLRFLLLSCTYGTRGYPYSAPDVRQRLVGLEVGLNLAEILYALKVQQDTWWGVVAHLVFDNFRFPFTQAGFRYDLNHGKWYAVNVNGL